MICECEDLCCLHKPKRECVHCFCRVNGTCCYCNEKSPAKECECLDHASCQYVCHKKTPPPDPAKKCEHFAAICQKCEAYFCREELHKTPHPDRVEAKIEEVAKWMLAPVGEVGFPTDFGVRSKLRELVALAREERK